MANTDPITTFKKKAPWIMGKLMQDFPFDLDDAAAVLGNLGHECMGFTKLQEIKPTVKGSRGGFGWPQWTGPRRIEYETYCSRNRLDPAGDKANYAFLFLELKGSESRAVNATRRADGLQAKVEAFEMSFLRAGVKHYDSRLKWAKLALVAYSEAPVVGSAQPNPPVRQVDIVTSTVKSASKAIAAGKAAMPASGGTGLLAWGAQKLGWLQGWTLDDFANLMLGLGIASAFIGAAWVSMQTWKAPANEQPDIDG